MTCNFCGRFQENNEYKNKVILDFGDRQVVIFCCASCLQMLEILLNEQYVGRNKIEQEFYKQGECK
jgi:hypothetical protein